MSRLFDEEECEDADSDVEPAEEARGEELQPGASEPLPALVDGAVEGVFLATGLEIGLDVGLNAVGITVLGTEDHG